MGLYGYTNYRVGCDACGEARTPKQPEFASSEIEAIGSAEKVGYVYEQGYWFCPSCQKDTNRLERARQFTYLRNLPKPPLFGAMQ